MTEEEKEKANQKKEKAINTLKQYIVALSEFSPNYAIKSINNFPYGIVKFLLSEIAVLTSFPSQFEDNAIVCIITLDEVRYYVYASKNTDNSTYLAASYADKWNGNTAKWVTEVLRSNDKLTKKPVEKKWVNPKGTKPKAKPIETKPEKTIISKIGIEMVKKQLKEKQRLLAPMLTTSPTTSKGIEEMKKLKEEISILARQVSLVKLEEEKKKVVGEEHIVGQRNPIVKMNNREDRIPITPNNPKVTAWVAGKK
jgi:hypothetical protein